MSDFDDVLERLVIEPDFRAALTTDPVTALSGYRLSPDELDLLATQLTSDDGGAGGVEERISKASLAGLFAPLMSLFGNVGGAGGHATAQFFPAGNTGEQGLADVPADQGLSETGVEQGLSDVHPAEQGLADVHADQGLSAVAHGSQPLGHLDNGDHTPVGYHPHIDADGNGHWDSYTAVQHSDGSVDIYVDRNHDGKIDFVGHDRNADGRVESADYDEDFNGTYETRMRDVNGDGWLDVRQVTPDS